MNQTLTCWLVCVPLLLGALVLAGTLAYQSRSLASFLPLHPIAAAPCGSVRSPPLRVYMYDLPPRFNVQMLDPSFPDGTPVAPANFPAWRWNDRLLRQHSMEYWLMASLVYDGGDHMPGSTREAVRVSDPDSADVFFVPFFSSLSFNIYAWNKKGSNGVDEQLQLELLNILRASTYWKRSGGRDHVIPLHHPNAFKHYRDRVNSSIFIVADFGRILKISRLAKDVVAPYPHMVDSYMNDEPENAFESRETLLFFRGGTKRKDAGKIRVQLHKILNGTNDVIYEEGHASGEGFKASAERMQSSKFCLHPTGDTPSSCRLFDAIVSHCVPVIVSDKIELPFENEMDYSEFSIFFSANEALKPGYMVSELRKISKEKWMKMWLRLKSISHHFEFNYPPVEEDAVNMIWRQVKQKVPSVKLAVHRSTRLKIPDWWRR
ncbi:exostosin-like protein [Striga asiatica]|uniref:Exostosin-like protein n=1 Tax=Striga asiatica TaxID=4170 RepID=A0A5A7RFX9_STRAF|nr:exostosin-like protein [Striga asiatica]